MASKISLSMIDRTGEGSRMQWYGEDLNAGNLVADTVLHNAIRTAAEAITLLNEVNLSASLTMHSASGVKPTDAFAQRELGLRVFYTDTVNNRKGHVTIPGPDLTLLTFDTDIVSLDDNGAMEAFVTAFEAGATSRDGNPVAVYEARIIGRFN